MNFLQYKNDFPEYEQELRLLQSWRNSYPDETVIVPTDVIDRKTEFSVIRLVWVLGLLVRRHVIELTYRIRYNDILLDEDYNCINDIPQYIYDKEGTKVDMDGDNVGILPVYHLLG